MVTAEALLLLALSGAGDPVLLDFSAQWCTPCRMMEPTVQRLVSAGYPVRQIDIDQHPELAARYRVTSVPCFVLLADGREVDRVVGAVSHARLLQMFAARPRSPVDLDPSQLAAAGSQGEGRGRVRGQSPDRQRGGFSFPDPFAVLGRRDAPQPSAGAPPRDPLSGNGNPPAIEQALAATVRVKVEDPDGHSYGTGTIIDTHDGEALVGTCGHIFRDSRGEGRILVDLLVDGATRTVPGTLISYDLRRDIALLSIAPGAAVTAVAVAPAGYSFRAGDPVFSIGCDHGQAPSVRESQITGVDKYLGPPNLEVAGQPVDGRSGGGLFSADGLLIGICNAADPADNEGIYASLPTIHWELDRIGQRRIYQPEGRRLERSLDPAVASTAAHDALAGAAASAGSVPRASVADRLEDTEIICIVRTKSDSAAGERLLILNQPSREFLDHLARESRAVPAADGLVPVAERTARGGPPVVRAQSADR